MTANDDPGSAVDEMARLRADLAARDDIITQGHHVINALREEIDRLKAVVAQRDAGIQFYRLEVARLSREPMEQRDWWDKQFSESWEKNSGPAQSCYFMQCIIANLPAREREFLSSRKVQILDWGCATGDGLNELAKVFPLCDGIGVDLSKVAIVKAQLKYPSLKFISTERGTFDEHVDVVVTSNCLEHFDAPLEWLEHLLRASEWLVMVLVPYREENRIEDHKVSFSEESFPEVFRGFTRLHAIPFQTEPPFWAGHQLLVVYASGRYMQEFKITPVPTRCNTT